MQKARPGAIRTGGSSVGTGVLDGPLFYRRGDSRIARKIPHPTARAGGHLPPGEGFEKRQASPVQLILHRGFFRFCVAFPMFSWYLLRRNPRIRRRVL